MKNIQVGKYGEELACNFLISQGYGFVARNVKISYQEIDLVFTKDNKIIFVEVKTRISLFEQGAEEALNFKKYESLKKGILSYLKINKLTGQEFQLDLVAIYINKQKKCANIKHYKDVL